MMKMNASEIVSESIHALDCYLISHRTLIIIVIRKFQLFFRSDNFLNLNSANF